MSTTSSGIPILGSLQPLRGSTDAWISDVWGVLHNGIEAFPAAASACVQYRESGGTVVLVTNAPRPAASVISTLDALGIPRSAWDAVLTSGDVSRSMAKTFGDVPIFHLGPPRMAGIFEGLEHRLVKAEDAELVVCTGLFEDEAEQPEDYQPLLAPLASRQVPLICANPDIMVERGTRLVPCAGSLAEIYARLGGPVHYAGKPFPDIYERAFQAISAAKGSLPEKGRILAIGDGLRTDIEGARRAGLPSVFIASALHVAPDEPLDEATLQRLFGGHPRPPVAAMRCLAW